MIELLKKSKPNQYKPKPTESKIVQNKFTGVHFESLGTENYMIACVTLVLFNPNAFFLDSHFLLAGFKPKLKYPNVSCYYDNPNEKKFQ